MTTDLQLQKVLRRQHVHWTLAIERLTKLDDIASPQSWAELERQTGAALRSSLMLSIRHLARKAAAIKGLLNHKHLAEAERALQELRRDYLRTETMVDFFADAINTRTNPKMRGLLAAADMIASQSMRGLLDPLGQPTPPVLVYIDKGLGASILKANLRLWDRRTANPVAAIKVVRHNLLRFTSLLHEAGHQIAHILDWNKQLASRFAAELPDEVGRIFASWASEVAADAFAFAHAGFASVSALHDVVDGGKRAVFRIIPGDPHPQGYLRYLTGIAQCRAFFGRGPWDEFAEVWKRRYPIFKAPVEIQGFMEAALPLLPKVTEIILQQPYPAFGDRPLAALINPKQVSPAALAKMEEVGGATLYTSPHLVKTEAIRLLALSGYRLAMDPEKGEKYMTQQLKALLTLGEMQAAA